MNEHQIRKLTLERLEEVCQTWARANVLDAVLPWFFKNTHTLVAQHKSSALWELYCIRNNSCEMIFETIKSPNTGKTKLTHCWLNPETQNTHARESRCQIAFTQFMQKLLQHKKKVTKTYDCVDNSIPKYKMQTNDKIYTKPHPHNSIKNIFTRNKHSKNI